jgi:hypothetical protein
LPPALAGGIKLGKEYLKALAKITFLLAKANFIFIHFPPAKAGGNSNPAQFLLKLIIKLKPSKTDKRTNDKHQNPN